MNCNKCGQEYHELAEGGCYYCGVLIKYCYEKTSVKTDSKLKDLRMFIESYVRNCDMHIKMAGESISKENADKRIFLKWLETLDKLSEMKDK